MSGLTEHIESLLAIVPEGSGWVPISMWHSLPNLAKRHYVNYRVVIFIEGGAPNGHPKYRNTTRNPNDLGSGKYTHWMMLPPVPATENEDDNQICD